MITNPVTDKLPSTIAKNENNKRESDMLCGVYRSLATSSSLHCCVIDYPWFLCRLSLILSAGHSAVNELLSYFPTGMLARRKSAMLPTLPLLVYGRLFSEFDPALFTANNWCGGHSPIRELETPQIAWSSILLCFLTYRHQPPDQTWIPNGRWSNEGL